MGGVGGLNCYPRVIGGAPSLAEKVHTALRAGLGGREGGGTGKYFWDGSIEDGWRFAEARAIGYVLGLMEQAEQEFFPHRASYNVDIWEDSLGLEPAPSLHERRLQIAEAWTDEIDDTFPGLQADLRERFADETITTSTDSDSDRVYMHYGKWLKTRTEAIDLFGPTGVSNVPGGSTAYMLRVLWPGVHTERELQLMRDRLNAVLPAWWNYTVFESLGFVLGTSKLGHVGLDWGS